VKQFYRVMCTMALVMMGLVMVALLCPFLGLAQEATIAAPAQEQPSMVMVLLGLGLAISEALALIPALKSNGLLHMAMLILKKTMDKSSLPVLALLLVLPILGGCGKTLDQLKQVAHQAIDVAGKVYEDVKDNVDTAKQTLGGAPASPPAR
jgi:hypothetical protein